MEMNISKAFNSLKEEVKSSKYETDFDSAQSFREKAEKLKADRNELYKELLDNYVDLAKNRNNAKEEKKNDFYRLIKNILIISGVVFLIFLARLIMMPASHIIKLLPIVITAFVAFLGEFISLPVIIANYLFDNKEDDNMTNIIIHTQRFDMENDTSNESDNNDKETGKRQRIKKGKSS